MAALAAAWWAARRFAGTLGGILSTPRRQEEFIPGEEYPACPMPGYDKEPPAEFEFASVVVPGLEASEYIAVEPPQPPKASDAQIENWLSELEDVD